MVRLNSEASTHVFEGFSRTDLEIDVEVYTEKTRGDNVVVDGGAQQDLTGPVVTHCRYKAKKIAISHPG